MKSGFIWVALTGALAFSCGSGAPNGNNVTGPETCDNGKDDNGDKKVDCADPKCFSSPKCKVSVERCDNGVDDDNNGNTDCLDMACQGADCGYGCRCDNMARTEITCADSQDNDSDNLTDCADPDCRNVSPCGTGAGGGSSGNAGGSGATAGGSGGTAGGSGGTAGGSGGTAGGSGGTAGGSGGTAGGVGATAGGVGGTAGGSAGTAGGNTAGGMAGAENCTDGLDNDGDRAVDCADSNCVGTAMCVALRDGDACVTNAQCAGGRCQTEAAVGYPSGYCTNAGACTNGTSTGCNGGLCVMGQCRATCTGNGMGPGGRCRTGYACSDTDFNPGTPNLCVAMCTSDAECAGASGSFGCNAMTKYCEQKTSPGAAYGAPCNFHSDCQSQYCLRGNLSGGYCVGDCRADLNNCGPGGYCQWNPSEGDNVGLCLQSCQTVGALCRNNPVSYVCKNDSYGVQMGKMCMCNFAGTPCGSDSDCCSNFCSLATSTCM